jgi:hypothetical protein
MAQNIMRSVLITTCSVVVRLANCFLVVLARSISPYFQLQRLPVKFETGLFTINIGRIDYLVRIDLLIFGKWDVGVDWIELAQDRDRWWAFVNGVMNLWVP